MEKYRNKLRALGWGFLLWAIIGTLLTATGAIRIGHAAADEWIMLVVLGLFWWIVIATVLYYILYEKRKRAIILKIAGLLLFFIVILINDSYSNIPDNPITIGLLMAFWIGVVYVALPAFFQKYALLLIGVCTATLLHFLYARLSTSTFNDYLLMHKERALLLLVLPIPAFIVLWVYEQWKSLRTLQSEKTAAELAMLKSQINPHFFFNTLNNLYALTVSQSEKAPEVVLKLSEMMRYTIYDGQEQWVTLEREVQYLTHYIELHQLRYHKTVAIQFTQQIDPNMKLVPLLFIILLENAFKHGVEQLRENAFVHLHLQSEDGAIYFSIKNNFDPASTPPNAGIGLANLQKRLALSYPKQHQLDISSEDGIFSVQLRIEAP